jgi:hypothetical protein
MVQAGQAAKEFAVVLLRGVIALLFLASGSGTADACQSNPIRVAKAAVEQVTPGQPSCVSVQSDSDLANAAAKSEEGSACSSLKPRSLKISELVGTHRVSCRGHVCCRATDEAALLRAASRLSVQIAFCVWRS